MPAQDKPNYKCKAHTDAAAAIQIVRDVSGGTPVMRKAGTTYLPKERRETQQDYDFRRDRTVLFEGYLRTRQSLVGMVFDKDIVLGDDVPAQIKTHLEDVDLAGNHIDVFAKRHFTDQFEGCAFILVDMEPSLSEGATLADEIATGRRPYWVGYKADQAINYRFERVKGKQEFSQITFEEVTCEPDGAYGEKEVTRYRTFRKVNGVVEWELNRLNPEAKNEEDKIVFEKSGVTTLSRIPVAVAGEIGKPPPLLGLAYLNISHWQNSSDQENILHITRVPMLVRIGAKSDQTEVVVGVTGTLDVDVDGDVKWLEVSADGAMSVGRQHLLDIEQRMGMMGLSTLTQRSDANITATEKKQDFQEKHSELATMARSEKDAIELALSFHAEYLGLSDGGSIELGVKEEQLTLTPQHLQVLLAAVQANDFSLETFLTVVLGLLRETGALAEDVNVDDEIARVKAAQSAAQAQALPSLASKALAGAPNTVRSLFEARSNRAPASR
jgi:hypothetical protein